MPDLPGVGVVGRSIVEVKRLVKRLFNFTSLACAKTEFQCSDRRLALIKFQFRAEERAALPAERRDVRDAR